MLLSDHPVPKPFRDGTHRLVDPEETLARVRPMMARMGITRVANVTGLDSVGVPVIQVFRPNSRSLAVSQGKGLGLAAAKASGLMESIELYHAERLCLPLRLGSYADLLESDRVVDATRLPSVAGSRFHDDLPLLWVEGRDLMNDESILVPYEVVDMNSCRPSPTGSGCFASSSNGLASGNHLLEAISHGLCEVIERDAATCWHRLGEGAQRATGVDLATVDDVGCLEVIDRCHRAGIDVLAWDITSDVGVASFQCLVLNRTDDPLMLLYAASGAGTHPARDVALLRALTEALQSRLTLIAGSRDDIFRTDYHQETRNLDYLAHQRKLLRDGAFDRPFGRVPDFQGADFAEDIARELSGLQSAGCDRAVVVDLTRPDLGIPVARVVVPGLEGSDKMPGFVEGPRARRVAEEGRWS